MSSGDFRAAHRLKCEIASSSDRPPLPTSALTVSDYEYRIIRLRSGKLTKHIEVIPCAGICLGWVVHCLVDDIHDRTVISWKLAIQPV
jgi:hypothetical protein